MSDARFVMVVAPEGFRDEELSVPKRVFEDSGATVKIASKGVSEAMGVMGASIPVDLDLSDVSTEDFDGIVFVGGGGSKIYFHDDVALSLARSFHDAGKVTSAICIAPSILANAGVLSGKNATVWESEETLDALQSGGAEYTGESATIDGNIVTGNGPEAAEEFARLVLKALS